ncbi:DUF2188 domain-containing protein [Methylobacterium durans]|uniref:DUF2188 domain-containing protein n=1 Tax=Methylobacterium durans TaxID=2202825 RepID=A0A2U8W5L0_9HYPH|nr:DUF2188 domain-containing protein [Methylobacterium durans]AWN41339.1 hypothetical protein DK389_13465 [Methylobacterium durans]MEA1832021.1 DUF2188 domain-containing protein [Methylobacterium durans]
MKKAQHVISRPGGRWSVRPSGAARASRIFATQAEAIRYARERAREAGADLYVHRRDGTISARDRYGSGPEPTRG